jgi:hypothetical protein
MLEGAFLQVNQKVGCVRMFYTKIEADSQLVPPINEQVPRPSADCGVVFLRVRMSAAMTSCP